MYSTSSISRDVLYVCNLAIVLSDRDVYSFG